MFSTFFHILSVDKLKTPIFQISTFFTFLCILPFIYFPVDFFVSFCLIFPRKNTAFQSQSTLKCGLNLQNSSDRYDICISCAADSNPVSFVHCIYNRPVSHVQSDMPVIQNNISGKCLFIADSNSHIFHIPCRPWQANPEMCIHRLYKSRAIRSFCQTGTAPYVRISDKLAGVIYDSLSRSSLILHILWAEAS